MEPAPLEPYDEEIEHIAQLESDVYPEHMKNLGRLVLNKKKDIKFHRNASYQEGAERYAKARGWTSQYADINNDHVDDIVLFDKKGRPVMINGYSLIPSEHKIREKYFSHPINDRVQYGGYKSFKKDMRGNGELELEMQRWPNGYAKIRKPARRNPEAHPDGSVYKRFCDRVKPIILNWISTRFGATQGQPARIDVLKKVIPFSSIYALLYIDHVIYNLWIADAFDHWVQAVCGKTTTINRDGTSSFNPARRLDEFKKYMSKNPNIVNSFATDTVLDQLVAANITLEELDRVLPTLSIDPRRIYQENMLPIDTDDLSTPEHRGRIAYEKEVITRAIQDAKDDIIRTTFNNEFNGRSYERVVEE